MWWREIGVTEVTYYRWRKRYGGIESELAEYLTELETEITRLRRLVSDLTLEKLIFGGGDDGGSEPGASCGLRASCQGCVWHLRKACLPGARAASIDPTQDTGTPFVGSATGDAMPFDRCEVAIDESLGRSSADTAVTADGRARVRPDSARSERADADPGFVMSTGAVNSVG